MNDYDLHHLIMLLPKKKLLFLKINFYHPHTRLSVSNQITIWMLVIAFATIVSLIVVPSLLGKSTITMIVVVLSLCNAVALLITLHYKRKIDDGLLFHAINYDYVS